MIERDGPYMVVGILVERVCSCSTSCAQFSFDVHGSQNDMALPFLQKYVSRGRKACRVHLDFEFCSNCSWDAVFGLRFLCRAG